MPTGYTHDVQTGKVTDFRAFALRCAKAFGACIEMRDEPIGTPIPDEFEPGTKHFDAQIVRAVKAIDRISSMSDDDCEKEAFAVFQGKAADYEKQARGREEERLRYKRMLAKVSAWTPPTDDHEGLKSFMQEQLTESIDHDCGGKEYDRYPDRETGKEWRLREFAAARRTVEHSTNGRDKEIERTNERNKWLKDLRGSLA